MKFPLINFRDWRLTSKNRYSNGWHIRIHRCVYIHQHQFMTFSCVLSTTNYVLWQFFFFWLLLLILLLSFERLIFVFKLGLFTLPFMIPYVFLLDAPINKQATCINLVLLLKTIESGLQHSIKSKIEIVKKTSQICTLHILILIPSLNCGAQPKEHFSEAHEP